MLGYIILFLAIFIIDRSDEPLGRKYFFAFWVLSVFSGIRYGIGYDYFSYYQLIQKPEIETEIIPMFLYGVARETHYSLFFIISAFFTNFFFLRGMCIRKCPFETVYFYMGWPLLYVSTFSTVRQYMAISLVFYLMCLHNAGFVKKALLVIIAFLCHRSSLIAIILLFPIDRIFSRKSLLVLFVFSLLLGEFFVKQLLSMSVDSAFYNNFQNFLGEDVEGGFYKRLLSYLVVALVLLNYNQLIDYGIHKKFLVYSIFGGCFYALFSLQTHIAMRFCTFFQVGFLIIVIGLCKLRRFPLFEYKFLCILLFASTIYLGHITSSRVKQWAKYRSSLYYPYETIFENNPDK
jgi:hypothetical protein